MVEVSGTVINSFTGEPIPGASVKVCEEWTRTDRSGEFSIEKGKGMCRVTITKSGFEPTSESLVVRTATHRTYYLKPLFKALR